MPQNTNLNASPYFDDFAEAKNYQRVLFKPGLPVQARELTTLQSILQNQVEKFGKHFFKEGSVVVPGQIAYDPEYTAVQIDESHLGIPVSIYLEQLVGKTIKGETSGVTAKVETYVTNSISTLNNYTLYVKYQSSSENDFAKQTFSDGENLITLGEISYGLSNIRSGSTFATAIISNATRTGSAAKVAEGVYFIRGFFVNVASQTVILDQYTNKPSYRVGLLVTEELVTASTTNNDLFDNARGFSNFAAPGADRFKISTTLIKKSLTDFDDENFVELLRIENGIVSKFVKNSDYNLIRDELARRTYDESGDYYVKPYTVALRESLNNRQGNNGIYFENQKTKGGKIPSDDLLALSVSPGKAYVRGYEIETINTTNVDLPKTRTTETQENESVQFTLGRQIEVNNVYGSTPVGFGTTSYVELYSHRTATPGTASGIQVGVARLYDLKLKNAEYTDATTRFEASLYDIQTFTYLEINTHMLINAPAFIEGRSSNASGYLYKTVNDVRQVILYQVNGQFQNGEEILVNGEEVARSITRVDDHRIDDVHQIMGVSGVPFSADPMMNIGRLLAPQGSQFTISAASGGVSTVTSPNANFNVGIKTGDIVSYSVTGNTVPSYNRVKAVNKSAKSVEIEATTNVTNVCVGTLPSGQTSVNDFYNVSLEVKNTADAYLFADLTRNHVANTTLTSSNIVIRKSYDVTVSGGALNQVLETDSNYTLEPFDEEDYNLTFNTGAIESLTDQKLTVSGRTVTLSNISTNGAGKLTVTWRKVNLKPKKKVYQRCSVTVINRSSKNASGITTESFNDGLTYSSSYGSRVQDRRICLGIADVASVIGIFESSGTTDPQLPKLVLTNLNANILNAIRGETIIGSTSGAAASYVTTNGTNEAEFVYLNENVFVPNELVSFIESKITANITTLVPGDRDIKGNFEFDPGQTKEIVDYSAIVRRATASAPTKRLKVVYNNYYIDPSDPGDFVVINSYDRERYTYDLPIVGPFRASDIIDVRPRVQPFTDYTTKSAFEFSARGFDPYTSSSTHILAKDKSMNLAYDFYVGRIDKLYLTKEGIFNLSKGVPALRPKVPNTLENALEVATVVLPPYIYNTDQITVSLASHKRYRMKDISVIEKRLKNVEYYTALSLLESETANMTLKDGQTNMDRFKSGFFVDNFKSVLGGDVNNVLYRASIDTVEGRLRPQHYTTSVDLLLGSEVVVGAATSSNPAADYRFVSDLGDTNVKRMGDVVCLNYDDVTFIENQFATRIENVNPFAVVNWIGQIELNPSTDTWIETRRSARTYDIEGSYNGFMGMTGADSNTGMSPIDWGSWETTWSGQSTSDGPSIFSNTESTMTGQNTRRGWAPEGASGSGIPITTTTTWEDRTVDFRNQTVNTTTNQTRQGIQFRVGERFDSTSLGDKVVSTDVIATMRARNIEFICRRLKPNTRVYSFFDNVDMNKYIVPKLIEVEMVSGTFGAGEVVAGTADGVANIRFRLATQNHKYGTYNSPSEVFKVNPYAPNDGISATYSSTATVLNVDTASLELQSASGYFGYLSQGMKLVGQSSGAIATVKDIRLVTDQAGVLIGSLWIPDATIPSTPAFNTGTKTFTLSTSATNETISGFTDSSAETNFTSQGTLQNVEESTLRMRNADVQRIPRSEDRTVNESETRLVADTTFANRTTQQTRWVDPLAESFEVPDINGVYLTKCDVFFKSKDTKSLPVTLQVRTLQTGLPTQTILPFGESILDPDDVVLSEDGTKATTFTFPSPVYCEGGGEFAIVLLSASNEYTVFISRMGEEDISTVNKADSEKIIVSQQPLLGSLFKSQNGATWDPSQLEDLKFTLYRADFSSGSGNVRFYNPDLDIGNRQIVSLRRNPVDMVARNVLVGLGKSLTSTETTALTNGITIIQENNPNFRAKLTNTLGAIGIGSDLTLSSVGAGFTAGAVTYSNVPLVSKTGRGSGALANISVNSGVAVAATVAIGGTGYSAGDILTVNSVNTGGFGKNLLLTIPNNVGVISAFNSLVLDRMQGTPKVDASSNVVYVSAGGTTILSGGNIQYVQTVSDGLHFRVKHNNHGMYSTLDRVQLFDIESDVKPEKITATYASDATTDIPVTSVGIYTDFENYGVNATNPGYVKIGKEIIKYTGVSTSSGTLTGVTRAIDDTRSGDYNINDTVHKYELNGVSLRRINAEHSFGTVDIANYPIDVDHYWVKVGVSSRGTDRAIGNSTGLPELFFAETKSGGSFDTQYSIVGSENVPRASQNIPFNILRPNVSILQPEGTSVSARVRTFTGNSPDGAITPYVDQGFEAVSLNSNNPFNSPRIIGAKINELARLTDFPGRKSFTMEFSLETADSKVSPMIDLDRVNIITTMDRINSKVSNYSTDLRVNSLDQDPSAAIYLSKPVQLEKPADGLRVMFDAYRHVTNDIRVMYRIFRPDAPSQYQLFELFPGYDNLDGDGVALDIAKNSGLPDKRILPSNGLNDFREYEYNAKDLPSYTGFQIKIIMTGTNFAFVPRLRDLRAIASI